MTTRPTLRSLVRDEVQDLFHEAFTLTNALEHQMAEIKKTDAPSGKAPDPQVVALEGMIRKLQETEEAIRSRVLPMLG